MTVTSKMIHIDNWVARGMPEQEYETVYKYLKDIIIALACKKGWFRRDELADFAQETASSIFLRMVKPNNYLKYKKDPKDITQIKNYLNVCLYGMSIRYRQNNYASSPKNGDKYNLTDLDQRKNNAVYLPQYNWSDSILSVIFFDTIKSIPKIIKEVTLNNSNNYYNPELIYTNILINLAKAFRDIKLNKGIYIKKLILYDLPVEEADRVSLILKAVLGRLVKEFRELLNESDLTLEDFYQATSEDFIGDINDET